MSSMIDVFLKHIVSLTWLDYKESDTSNTTDLSGPDVRAFAVSAFLLNIHNRCLLITAGHILQDLEKRLQKGRKILKSRIIDTSFSSSHSNPSIPFDLANAPKFYINENGLDYGVILLRQNYAYLLLAGNKIFLDQKYWDDIPDDIDNYYLLGFPAQAMEIEKIEYGNSGEVKYDLNIPLVPIQKVSEVPDSLKKENKRFYAKIPIFTKGQGKNEEEITDIDGMSGGPIFGIKCIDKQHIKYWIVAVQSGWLKRERILAASYILPLAHAIIESYDKKSE